MSPRRYRMSNHAASAEETRRRIVEATFALHVEKGVAATTFRDISTRADVGIGTIYQHFSNYDDVVDRKVRDDVGLAGGLPPIEILNGRLHLFDAPTSLGAPDHRQRAESLPGYAVEACALAVVQLYASTL